MVPASQFLTDRRWLIALGLLVVVLAGWIRWVQVSERVAHVDEGVQAYQTWRLMDEGVYDYSPKDRHGPVLYLVSAAAMRLAGISPTELSMEDLRSFSALWGLLLIVVFLLFGIVRREVEWAFGAAMLATMPFAVCYHNYYVQESLFAFLSFALVLLVARSKTELSMPGAALIGVLGGLLLATKETAVIHGFMLLGAFLLVGGLKHWRGAWDSRRLAVALAAAVAIWILTMSQGFRRWDAVIDGLSAYFHHLDRAGNPEHSKPFFYYISLFWPQFSGGTWWSQSGVLLAAIGGTVLVWRKRARDDGPRVLPFVAVFTWGLLLLYSMIPYKMPWLLLTPLSGLCVLGGVAVASLFEMKRSRLGLVLGLAACFLIAWESVRMWKPALFRYADDERNPYLYVHTSSGFLRLEQRLSEILRLEPEARVAVIGADSAWPLPWHLREHESVGYFTAVPENLEAFDLVILDASLAPDDGDGFMPGYMPEVHGLRANVLLLFYIRDSIWDRFTASPASP